MERRRNWGTEEQRLRRLVESYAQAVWETDAAGQVVTDSPSWRAFTGQSFEQWLGEGWLDAVHPDDRDEALRTWRTAVAEGGPLDAQFRVRTAHGEWRWTNVRALPVRDEDGAIQKWVGMNIDVHDRVVAEEALRAAHDTFRHLVEESPFGVYAVDADFRLVQVSAGAQKVFANVRPLLGRDFAEVLHIVWPEPFASEAIAKFRHTLATGEPYHAPSTVERRLDIGQVESYDWKIERVTLPDGRPGVVCHFYDLSERQQYEAALRDADRQKDDFIAVLAHELRNPLAPIRNSVAVLQSLGDEPPALARCRDIIARQVTHMTRLLDDLLDVARLSQGKLTLRPQPVALAEVLDAAIETARPALDEHGHVFTGPAGVDAVVEVDPMRMAQVFANLLHNAAKYTEPGGRIALDVETGEGEVRVTVRDSGVGIDAAMRERVFDLFTQAADQRARAGGGLGIGLGLARQLVELHGGRIDVHSEGPGRGSAFTVHLPRSAADQPASAPAGGQTGAAAVAGRRVLVVDDNRDAADSLAMLLEIMGAEARTAYDGAPALALIAEWQPALVFLDLGMPDVDGYEVAAEVRRQYAGREPVLVAVTGWGQVQDRQRTEAAGFHAHLVKPVDFDALAALLAALPLR